MTSNENYKQMQEKLTVFEKMNTRLQSEIGRQRHISTKKDDEIKLLIQQMNHLKEKVDNLETARAQPVVELKTNTSKSAVPLTEFDANRERRFMLDQGEAVAFHAVVLSNGKVLHGVNQTIVFETVLLNINGAYRDQQGIFVAPTNGLYIFSTSVLDGGSKPLIHADLVKNGNVLARAYGHGNGGYPEQGSVTVVTQLQTGDEIWVRLSCCTDSLITGQRYTSFTGALLMYI